MLIKRLRAVFLSFHKLKDIVFLSFHKLKDIYEKSSGLF